MEKPIFQFKIAENAKPITYDQICRSLLGMSFKEFVKAIQTNKDGKYDCVYLETNSKERRKMV